MLSNSFAFSKNCVASEQNLYIVTTVEGTHVEGQRKMHPYVLKHLQSLSFSNCEIINSMGWMGYNFSESWSGHQWLSDGLKCQKPRNTVEGNSFALLTSFKIHLIPSESLQSNIPWILYWIQLGITDQPLLILESYSCSFLSVFLAKWEEKDEDSLNLFSFYIDCSSTNIY